MMCFAVKSSDKPLQSTQANRRSNGCVSERDWPINLPQRVCYRPKTPSTSVMKVMNRPGFGFTDRAR